MKKIYFRKTTEYYLARDKNEQDRYDFLSKLTMQEVDPMPLHKFKNLQKSAVILCSPLNRVYSSLPLNANVEVENSLREVVFDLRKFCTLEEFSNKSSIIVREKFKEYFIQDILPEKRAALFGDIKLLLEKLQKLTVTEIMIISHSFKLKLIEAYIKTNGAIESSPELIHQYILTNEKTYGFEEGFDIEI